MKYKAVWEKTDGHCAYCGISLRVQGRYDPCALDHYSIDHVIPQSRGGQNCVANYLPSCRSCNSRKGTKTLEEYRTWLGESLRGGPFTEKQVAYLNSVGFELPLPTTSLFWFEEPR